MKFRFNFRFEKLELRYLENSINRSEPMASKTMVKAIKDWINLEVIIQNRSDFPHMRYPDNESSESQIDHASMSPMFSISTSSNQFHLQF